MRTLALIDGIGKYEPCRNAKKKPYLLRWFNFGVVDFRRSAQNFVTIMDVAKSAAHLL